MQEENFQCVILSCMTSILHAEDLKWELSETPRLFRSPDSACLLTHVVSRKHVTVRMHIIATAIYARIYVYILPIQHIS
jgi:hypothetical protein